MKTNLSGHIVVQKYQRKMSRPNREHLALLSGTPSRGINQAHYEHSLRRVKLLLHLEAALPPRATEQRQLLFDRLLLTVSANYRKTRLLASRMGVALEPEQISFARSAQEFSIDAGSIVFSPTRSEVLWLVEQKSPNQEHWLGLKSYHRSIYHELNHAIFYRKIQPKLKSLNKKETLFYLAVIESLVLIRDIELARELGEAGNTLHHLGLLFRSQTPIEKRPITSDLFEALFEVSVQRMLQRKNPVLEKVLEEAGLEPVKISFIDKTYKSWMKDYFKEGTSLKLPQAKTPLLIDSESFKFNSLTQWYLKTFR